MLLHMNNGTSGANDSFEYFISLNTNYGIYGLNMMIPALNFAYLYNSGGSNAGYSPNLYFYQKSINSSTTLVENPSGYRVITYTIDTGAIAFYNAILSKTSTTLGGYMQWVNGTLP